jgi:hypothetical protein
MIHNDVVTHLGHLATDQASGMRVRSDKMLSKEGDAAPGRAPGERRPNVTAANPGSDSGRQPPRQRVDAQDRELAFP